MSNTICLYINGSSITGYVRSAVVVLQVLDTLDSAILYKQTCYIGRHIESTMYVAELQCICLAFLILETSPDYEYT